MNNEVIVALIGLGGALLGGIAGVFKDEIRSFFLRSDKKSHSMIGLWKCEWQTKEILDSSAQLTNPVVESEIKIKKIRGEKVSAIGNPGKQNEYKLEGTLAISNIMNFTYSGTGKTSPIRGVVILKVNTLRNEMNGHWFQLNAEGDFETGTTKWTTIGKT